VADPRTLIDKSFVFVPSILVLVFLIVRLAGLLFSQNMAAL
jgi:hypothetical protein